MYAPSHSCKCKDRYEEGYADGYDEGVRDTLADLEDEDYYECEDEEDECEDEEDECECQCNGKCQCEGAVTGAMIMALIEKAMKG